MTILLLRNLLIASVAATAAAASTLRPPQAHELDEYYTFAQYLDHHPNKSYSDPAEYYRRKQIFEKNLKMILAHNHGKINASGELTDGSWVMGINKFTDQDPSEVPMGYDKSRHHAWSKQITRSSNVLATKRRRLGGLESYEHQPSFEMEDVKTLPAEVDWTPHMNVNIPNQGNCGGCWTFAAVATIEGAVSIATGEPAMTLSEQNLLECAPNQDQCGGTGQCQGATIELAYNYVADATAKKNGGMYSLSDLKYEPKDEKCDGLVGSATPVVGIEGWVKLPTNNYKAIMNAVAKQGPLGLALAASNWMYYEKGVMSDKGATVNHAVTLVGYGIDEKTGEKFWKIRNSWGSGFGEGGYIRIKRSDDDDTENCRLDNDPSVGVACSLDDSGNKVNLKPVKVCGDSAVLFDASYPVGAHHV